MPLPSPRGVEQAGLDQQVLRVRRGERLCERVPRVGRVAEAECRPHLDRHAAALEVRRGRVAGPREPLGEEALRRRERLEEPVAPVVARAAALAARDRHAEARREHLDGLREFQAVHLADEVDDVAARAAAEAVVEALVAVDGEGRRALVVERAEALPRAAGLLERRVVADDATMSRRAAQLREDVVVDVEVGRGHVSCVESQSLLIAIRGSLRRCRLRGRRPAAGSRPTRAGGNARAGRRAAGRCRGRG